MFGFLNTLYKAGAAVTFLGVFARCERWRLFIVTVSGNTPRRATDLNVRATTVVADPTLLFHQVDYDRSNVRHWDHPFGAGCRATA